MLTVGEVSGLVAVGVVVVKVLLPNILTLLFLGSLREDQATASATAVSWSVTGRLLHSSLWPVFLQTDSAASRGVAKSILFYRYADQLATVLIAVAAVVTPFGIYDAVVANHTPSAQRFHYIPDTGIFGEGTMPRDPTVKLSRICGTLAGPVLCPSSFNNFTTFKNSTGEYFDVGDKGMTSKIEDWSVGVFSAGVPSLGASVCGPFDIEYRSLRRGVIDTTSSVKYDNGSSVTIPWYRPIAMMVLNNGRDVIEGLVVDTVDGGIGFRNHTAPPLVEFGTTWSEDLLFVEPLVQCVDTNLTVDFELPMNRSQEIHSSSGVNRRLVDHGGFANLTLRYPSWDKSDPQARPELYERAHKAAWMHNMYTAAFLNVTNLHNASDPKSPNAFRYFNTTLGREFPLDWPDGTQYYGTVGLQIGGIEYTQFGSLVTGLDEGSPASEFKNYTSGLNQTTPARKPLYTNPNNVNSRFFTDVVTICQGAGGQDLANITNIATVCALVFGTPRPKNDSSSTYMVPGSSWTTPLYTCAGVTKASIKAVEFGFNTTDNINGLMVRKITPKSYTENDSMPLWAVEKTTMILQASGPLWGMTTPEALVKIPTNVTSLSGISTLRSPSLFLPGYGALMSLKRSSVDNNPGADFAVGALSDALGAGFTNDEQDYTGHLNLAMGKRWQQLSRSADSFGKIFELIWTDIAANGVVGTKTATGASYRDQLTKRETSPQILVTEYHRTIRYELVYAIPAFVVLLIFGLLIVATSLTALLGRTGFLKMKRYLNATSAGRIMTSSSEASDESDTASINSTRVWLKKDGRERVVVKEGRPIRYKALPLEYKEETELNTNPIM